MAGFTPYTRAAYYYETDKMSIVHHSNYVRWLEETRVDMLSQAGYPFEKMEAEGVLIPVLEVSIQYRYPVRFGDTFKVVPKVTAFNGCKITVSYEIYNLTAGNKLSASATTKHCLTDTQMRPIRSQKTHQEIFKVFNDALVTG